MNDLIQNLIDAGRQEQQRSFREAVRAHAAEDLRKRLLSGLNETRERIDLLCELTPSVDTKAEQP